jgi:hypothetical protein
LAAIFFPPDSAATTFHVPSSRSNSFKAAASSVGTGTKRAECKLLLLGHAFDVIGVNRVSLVTAALNLRSQAGIAKLGAVREGVLRSHMVAQGGRGRDTVVFSILAAEWPAVRARLEARLAADNRSETD